MKTALVLGITGNFGSEMAKALASQDWQIKTIVRNRQKLNESQLGFDILEGDFQDAATLQAATEGVELIVYAVNPPYPQWHSQALAMLEPVAQLAQQKRLQILFPGNVYNFSLSDTPIAESAPAQPVAAKGKIRAAMETRLQQASQSGAKVTIIRAGDFLGQHGQWLNMMLKKKPNHYLMRFPHGAEHQHFWSYLPDLCANAAKLIERQTELFEIWHDPGLVLTQEDWRQAFEQNGYALKITRFPWWQFSLLSYFVPLIREVLEMKYLWDKTLILDGSKLKTELGEQCQQTKLDSIVKQLMV
ncbi:NAD(P)H-binding protein [Vibrio sp.]|uniref:NAD(P)H-binding protein n=1 Tax=Vibrio sp. TaxID=678 RepID=UPI003D135AF6